MAVGGEAQGQYLYTVEWYVETKHKKSWNTAIHTNSGTTLSTSSARAGMAIVNIGNFVYVIGLCYKFFVIIISITIIQQRYEYMEVY